MSQPTLETILAATRRRIAELRPRTVELEHKALAAPVPRAFEPALRGASVGIIAEVKRRSPSAGSIAESLDPVGHAEAYARGGAAAISVLTDELHFGGSLEDLARVTSAVPLPALRKDFILDELQLFEARAAGASAILLIVKALKPARLKVLAREARQLELGVLVEAHAEWELDAALGTDPNAVGVNSRDLATFAVDLEGAERLVARVPPGTIVVAESGIETRSDVARMAAAGADCVLVGTSVARSADPAASVRALCGVARQGRAARQRTNA